GVVRLDRLSRPQLAHGMFFSTVQVVLAIVSRQLIRLSIQLEFGFRDPVGITAAYPAEVRTVDQVLIRIHEMQRHVGEIAVTIGDFDRSEDATSIDQSDFQSVLVSQTERGDFAAVFGLTEWFAL